MTSSFPRFPAHEQRLSEGWTLTLTDADAFATPADMPRGLESIPAPVPGTVAEALEASGQFDRTNPRPLNGFDAWYRLTLITENSGKAALRFDGLATFAEIYLNGHLIAVSQSMYEAYEVPVDLTGSDELAICFRALAPRLEASGPRARWRPQMMSSQGLRLIRTTTLGYMPGWCPEIHAAGPWRPIILVRPSEADISAVSVKTDLTENGTGILKVSFHSGTQASLVQLSCAGQQVTIAQTNKGFYEGEIRIADIEPWWPHTHGKPQLHDIFLLIDGISYPLGRTGFRRLEIDRGNDGQDFGLIINGEAIFCRGAVWTTPDIVRLPGVRSDYEPWLRLAAEAGMNMIRIGGTMVYESAEFFALCDELGIMIWQDLMLANFDYPIKDETLKEHIAIEVRQFLESTIASPSLVIICGGSEMHQQGAMLGLPERIWKGQLTEEILPAMVKDIRPELAYVPNSPSGGALPFFPNAGVAHYYGVGAYCRPMEDARHANIRFAAECLAFANVPQQSTLDEHLPVQSFHDPRWKNRVPRDRGASWDFEDVRDHYLKTLYGHEPATLRRQDPQYYLDLSRSVTCEVMETTFAEWRRNASSCNGALVWTLQDLLPGAGWGVIDATGEPKPVWYALKRAFRPVQLALIDEGTNGLDIHITNETADSLELLVELTCLRDGSQAVVSGRRELTLDGRDASIIPATDLLGAFFDTTYAYRFGPPSHDVTVARLYEKHSGIVIAEAFHFPIGRSKAMHASDITATLGNENDRWFLTLTTDRLAQSVHLDIEGFRPADDWFHLAPGEAKKIELMPRSESDLIPQGEIRALGSNRTFRF